MANSPTLHAVVFRIGEIICAAPAGIVREILPRLPATRIPGVPDAVEGLVNVRGSLLTVLDGHLLLDQQRRPTDEGAIVVLEVKGRGYGLGVGQVLDFLEVPAASVVERRDLPGVDPRSGEGGGPESRPALHPARRGRLVCSDHRRLDDRRPLTCREEVRESNRARLRRRHLHANDDQ